MAKELQHLLTSKFFVRPISIIAHGHCKLHMLIRYHSRFFVLVGHETTYEAIGNYHFFTTLESGIDVGQGITIGPGKFVKKNKRRALNKHRA